MSDNNKGAGSWWQTVPGILTGIAAVITAVAGLLALLFQNGVIATHGKVTPSQPPSQQQQPSSENPPDATADQTLAGHLLYKIVDRKVRQYAVGKNGKPIKYSLNVSLRITETLGVADYIDRTTIRLVADGAELFPENSINVAVYAKQSVDVDATFVVAADVRQAELLVGRNGDATARIPISINP